VYLEGILQFERGSDQWDEPAAILVGPVCEEGANSRTSLVNGGENRLALPIVRRFIVFHQFFDGPPVQSILGLQMFGSAPSASGCRAHGHARGERGGCRGIPSLMDVPCHKQISRTTPHPGWVGANEVSGRRQGGFGGGSWGGALLVLPPAPR